MAVVVSNIQRITHKELALASQDLRQLKRIGRQLVQQGDHLGSGILARQLRQIVAAHQVLSQLRLCVLFAYPK